MTMMQKAEALLGRMLRGVHSSMDKLAANQSTAHATILVESPAFKAYFPIPKKYTQDGANVSPPLNWTGVPADARELLLICEDPDAPKSDPVVHWILYRLPPEIHELPENIMPGVEPSIIRQARQSRNYAGEAAYLGPKPPLGHGVHHYHFQLFALDEPLRLHSEFPTKEELVESMNGHVLSQGELVGTYERVAN